MASFFLFFLPFFWIRFFPPPPPPRHVYRTLDRTEPNERPPNRRLHQTDPNIQHHHDHHQPTAFFPLLLPLPPLLLLLPLLPLLPLPACAAKKTMLPSACCYCCSLNESPPGTHGDFSPPSLCLPHFLLGFHGGGQHDPQMSQTQNSATTDMTANGAKKRTRENADEVLMVN